MQAADVQDETSGTPGRRDARADRARRALVDAAVRLLPTRAPSTITGRDLAAEAGVNYGLVHHYFGTKDAVLRAGLVALRDDFVGSHDDVARMGLLTEDAHPYLQAWARSQTDDPDTVAVGDDFPIGHALVSALRDRLDRRGATDVDDEARARAIAMVAIQVGYAVYGRVLREGAGVTASDRDAVEHQLAAIYDSLALLHESPRDRSEEP